MISQALLDYINKQQQIGKSKEEITTALLGEGWKLADVEQGFVNIASGVPAPVSSELPKARQIFDEAWAIYKNRFKTLFAIGLIPTLTYWIVFLIIGDGTTPGIVDKVQLGNLGEKGIALGIICAVIMAYLYIWASVSTLYAIKDQAEGINWKQAYARSRGKIGAYFSTMLLVGLAVFGGLVLLIIPGILFSFWFSQAPYIIVEENLKNSAALKKSKHYIKGRVGPVFGKLLYIGLITLALYILLAIVLGTIDSIAKINPNDTAWLGDILSLIWTPLVTVFAYQLYKHVKATRP